MSPVDVLRLKRKDVEDAWAAAQKAGPGGPLLVRDAHGAYWTRSGDASWASVPPGKGTHGPGDVVDVPTTMIPAPAHPRAPHGTEHEPKGIDAVKGFADQVDGLRQRFEDGRLSALQAESLARGRVLVDRDGRVWTAGLETGLWYAFEHARWHARKQPPDPKSLVRLQHGRRGCHACGAPAKDEAPCGSCHEPPTPRITETPSALAGLAEFLQTAPDPMLPERAAPPWRPPEATPGLGHRRT